MTSFTEASATRLGDRDYFDFLLASVEASRHRVWASIFIHDVRPSRDVGGQVLDLTMALIARHSAGVDVRVLLTGHLNTPGIAVANLSSGLMLDGYGVPHRRVFDGHGKGRSGSHAKYVVCDEVAVAGSQNWTADGFLSNMEDAVILTGQPVSLLAQEFSRLWSVGRGMPRVESN